MVKLNKEKHEYERDGIIIPGVTTILKKVGIIDYGPYVNTGKGTRIHSISDNYIKNTLDYNKITDDEIKFLNEYQKLIKEFNFNESEKIVENTVYNYAGTCDLISQKYIGELKTGKPEDWHLLQLAAYVWSFPDKRTGIMIYPFEKKKITVYPMHDLKNAYRHFLCALDVYNFTLRSKNA